MGIIGHEENESAKDKVIRSLSTSSEQLHKYMSGQSKSLTLLPKPDEVGDEAGGCNQVL